MIFVGFLLMMFHNLYINLVQLVKSLLNCLFFLLIYIVEVLFVFNYISSIISASVTCVTLRLLVV